MGGRNPIVAHIAKQTALGGRAAGYESSTASNIQITHKLCILLDKEPARLNGETRTSLKGERIIR